ncbi:MAG: PIN domain-containing protein [Deltaproteobacteria bacterium]|nr:PIN domain-containing protein [Deltaproteobacteria bacterium]
MLVDTDILIWVQRGNKKASELINGSPVRNISLYTYLELLQGAQSKKQHETVKNFLQECGFETIPLSQNIGHRAAIYLEEYSLSCGLTAGDAIIAATAAESAEELATGNAKHFKPIKELRLKIFRP